ncbi:hypothetical protein M407DRAFT_28666 [Tulasnella calospora MUT 4182]|uniref:Uncharacterized protein n=1 Tax=Tulasnella calospora MUT 4182 TaxID=1051891 RepID=A0A0C3Q0Z5_9AGAM|nr:hypothetical protein M407DRAFT_28666 [Tulasnella calospora MUT 4182]
MWVDRARTGLDNSASFGKQGNNWNTVHFFNVTEFPATVACLDRPAEGDHPDCHLGLHLTIGALAILGDDTINTVSRILN